MVHNEYGKRDLDIANNARMSNSLDPNSVLCLTGVSIKKKKKIQPKIVFKTTRPKKKKNYLQCFLSLAGNGIIEQIKNKKPRLNQRNKKKSSKPINPMINGCLSLVVCCWMGGLHHCRMGG